MKKCVAVLTGPDTYLDHLAPVSHFMEMPLLVTEEQTYESALRFYPFVNIVKKDLSELSIDFFCDNFDVIFESGKFWAAELKPLFSLFRKKEIRFVFCPHGNSDKGHSLKKHVPQDVSLFYGSHMFDLLQKTGALSYIDSPVRTGNYRLLFYKKFKSFYDELSQKLIKNGLNPYKKTVLYAPTWQDGENPSSFFTATTLLIDRLKEKFNLIIKIHPFLEEFHPANTYKIVSAYENTEGVLFLKNYPAIYSLLDLCDLYIGDYSSIGYDFLAFDKPLYFLPGSKGGISALHGCGMILENLEKASSFIETTLEDNLRDKRARRKEVYDYAFGEEKDLLELKEEIYETLSR